jgi:hypothetical protein
LRILEIIDPEQGRRVIGNGMVRRHCIVQNDSTGDVKCPLPARKVKRPAGAEIVALTLRPASGNLAQAPGLRFE